MRYNKTQLIARRIKILPIKYVQQDMTTYSRLALMEHVFRLYCLQARLKETFKQKTEKEIHYLKKNAEYIRYAQFRAQGLFVGSGVVEAGCKTLIGQRLKQSGMEWSVRGANAIISLRSILMPGRFENHWESRVA